EDKSTLHQLHIGNSKNVWLDPRHLQIEERHHKGNIYCLTTTHGNFYMEQNGRSFWTGNSDGKTKLQRVSHIITGLTIESDGSIMGEAEILDTDAGKNLKAILKAGGEVGVSSRGFGSTKPRQDGNQEVGEDFVLRTYDFVADPAMKTAYPKIFTEDVDEVSPEDQMKADFPDLVESIRKEEIERIQSDVSKKVEKAVSAAISEARASDSELFERRLIECMSGVRESVEEGLREEFDKDPRKGGAIGVLEAISDLVDGFKKDPDTEAIRDALKAKDLEIASVEEERDALSGISRRAVHQLHVERRLRMYPFYEAVMSALGGVGDDETIDILNERVDKIIEDFEPLVERSKVSDKDREFAEEKVQLESEIDRLRSQLESVISDRDDQKRKLKRSAEIGLEFEDKAGRSEAKAKSAVSESRVAKNDKLLAEHKLKRLRGMSNTSAIINLMEDANTTERIDELARKYGRTEMADPSLEKWRQKVRKGTDHVAPGALDESSNGKIGSPAVFGNQTMADVLSLSGASKVT
ncbi:MAG: hypothetical protein KAJ19_23685, partial [Gammaproteobacteria bacterium]|nr:hypothetical protein [Gammaproteobacteria bacterium]